MHFKFSTVIDFELYIIFVNLKKCTMSLISWRFQL